MNGLLTGLVSRNKGGTATMTAPAAPANLVATAGDSTVGLAWDASAYASGYTLYRSEDEGGPYDLLDSTAGTTFADSTAVNDTEYFYVVKARNAGGLSSYSSEDSATPTAP